jgi:anaerobic C4-dicarboxylate transporter
MLSSQGIPHILRKGNTPHVKSILFLPTFTFRSSMHALLTIWGVCWFLVATGLSKTADATLAWPAGPPEAYANYISRILPLLT